MNIQRLTGMMVLSICLATTVCLGNGTNTLAKRVANAAAAVESDEWCWQNATYGPLEIGSSAGMPFVGMFLGGMIGTIVPLKGMKPGCKVLVPYMAIGGVAVGAVAGALLTPVVMIEGLFDTFTGGAFANRPFAWFNVRVLTSTDDILDDGDGQEAVSAAGK